MTTVHTAVLVLVFSPILFYHFLSKMDQSTVLFSSYMYLYEVLIVPSLTPVLSDILDGGKSNPNTIEAM